MHNSSAWAFEAYGDSANLSRASTLDSSMKENNQRVVVCAANRSKSTGSIICGARHWDNIMRDQAKMVPGNLPKEWVGSDQGFIDQFGVWMDRHEAWDVARIAGQVKGPGHTEGTLYSEDLY